MNSHKLILITELKLYQEILGAVVLFKRLTFPWLEKSTNP